MTDNAIGQAILDAIQGIKADVSSLKADVSDLKAEIGTWPDLNFLQAAAQQQMNEARQAREFRRHVEIKLDEIYGSMATSSEINKLREEVAESTERERALDLRVATIENRLGIKNPLSTE
jgi:geranylgeranyl pyrophosphate synthase